MPRVCWTGLDQAKDAEHCGGMTSHAAESHAALEAQILRLVAERGPDKTICPSDAAIALAGPSGDAWGALMPQIRKIAVRLASEGRIVITRKGKQVDPLDFKGVYRLGQPRSE
jgi:Protein of unknown function (DUF3253)